ncbi:MAG: GNAT family N-acetyltransferase [Candidatus Pristimantibacillus sp.]
MKKDDNLVGVILLSTTGREHARIDRFYIIPQFQGKQIGTIVLHLIERKFQHVSCWSLDTSQKSTRNHHFYEKNGYKLMFEDAEERYYCKLITGSNIDQKYFVSDKDYSKHNFRDCNMKDADYYSVNLANANFSNSNMSSLKLQNINLSSTYITNTNLRNTIIGDSNMSKMEICHVSMESAHIHDANLQNLIIDDCNLEGMRIDGVFVCDLLKLYNSR